MKASAKKKFYLRAIYDILTPLWPEAAPLLSYSTPFELLCAVILSAQSTDEQVNRVTPALFARYPDAEAMAKAPIADIEHSIHSVGFFHTKAKHLIQTAHSIVYNYGGRVPDTMEGLLTLPGVGRKTANLVASACFGLPGIIVDTHVMRTALRLGIHDKGDPTQIEKVIALNLDPSLHTAFSHALNRHGKHVCSSRKPACLVYAGQKDAANKAAGPCPLIDICPRIGV